MKIESQSWAETVRIYLVPENPQEETFLALLANRKVTVASYRQFKIDIRSNETVTNGLSLTFEPLPVTH